MFVDFFVDSEWIGTVEVSNIASIPTPILEVTSEFEFRRAIQCFFQECDSLHGAPPHDRPAPWADYVYKFRDGFVYGSNI